MPQFFIDTELDLGSEVEIRGSDAKHIATVLRLAAGDWLVIADGKGSSYRAEIVAASTHAVTARITGVYALRVNAQPPVLAQAIIKHDRNEWIIQKAVELGVREIVPFHSVRTIPRLGTGVTASKLKRWNRIALEAAKQSGLPFVPQVAEPVSFDGLIARVPSFATSILFWEGERERDLPSLKHRLSTRTSTLVIIGPEGGFTVEEVQSAILADVITASLGPQILRVETACLAALAICQYEAGGFAIVQR